MKKTTLYIVRLNDKHLPQRIVEVRQHGDDPVTFYTSQLDSWGEDYYLVSREYIDYIINKSKEHYYKKLKLECIYEVSLKRYIGKSNFRILQLLQEICPCGHTSIGNLYVI